MALNFDSLYPGQPIPYWLPDDPILATDINPRERVISGEYYSVQFNTSFFTGLDTAYIELGGSSDPTGVGPLDTKIPMVRLPVNLERIYPDFLPGGPRLYKASITIGHNQGVTYFETAASNETSTTIDVFDSSMYEIGQIVSIRAVVGDSVTLQFENIYFAIIDSKPSATEIVISPVTSLPSFDVISVAMNYGIKQVYAEAVLYGGVGTNSAFGSGTPYARVILDRKQVKTEDEIMSLVFMCDIASTY